jgi:hypothetical protein
VSDKTEAFFVGMMAGAFLMVIVLGISSRGHSERDMQSEAIKRGYAHMVVTDSLTGETQFKWRDVK